MATGIDFVMDLSLEKYETTIKDQAAEIKPDASALKAHDDALIERCAGLINKLEEAKRNPFSRDHNNGLQHAIDIIRELKERK